MYNTNFGVVHIKQLISYLSFSSIDLLFCKIKIKAAPY